MTEELRRLQNILADTKLAAINVLVNTSRSLNSKCMFEMLRSSLRTIVAKGENLGSIED